MFRPNLRRPLSRVLAASALALVVLVTVMPQLAFALDAGLLLPGDPAVMNLISAEQVMLDLTNADRIANGLEPLQLDQEALPVARERAEDQLGTASLSHYDANGELVFARLLLDAQLPYQMAGENLARASANDPSLAPRIEQALMQSPAHRKNILEPGYKRVAIGAATDGQGQITFAELYRD
jgi:uncharacterized protein YkwD